MIIRGDDNCDYDLDNDDNYVVDRVNGDNDVAFDDDNGDIKNDLEVLIGEHKLVRWNDR